MPTYDYVCDACGHKFEHFQSITSEMLKKCPKCKKSKLRRLFGTGAAVVFKGSGFYQTDYRSDNYKQGATADKSNSEGKSESKSEGKSGEGKSSETKSNDSKSSENKSSEGRSGSSKGDRKSRGSKE